MFGFILAFFVLGPILIFYASGYRYDLKRHKVLKTGTLMLEAKNLKKADLLINGELYKKPFSEKIYIYNLLPGEYQIQLEKDGYHPWQKKLTINSSLTTFAKDIILFKKEVPLQIIEDKEINDFSLAPDDQKIIYQIVAEPFLELYYYDLTTKEENLIYRISSQEKISSTWSASSKKILLKVDNDFLVFDLQNLKQALEIKDILGFTPAETKWDLQSDNLLYAQKDFTIYKINLLSKDAQIIFKADQKINPDFFIEANDLFYLQKINNQNILSKYNFNFNTAKKVLELSNSNNYRFIKSTNNFIGLLDLDQKKLYLIKKTNSELEISIKLEEPIKEFAAKDAVWDEKEKQLLIYDDFEINIYNAETDQKTFINRYGQVIKKAAWYPDLNHLVILFENNLQITDLDLTESMHNITEIAKFDQLGNFYLSQKGEIIFFNGKIGKQKGLYQLNLK